MRPERKDVQDKDLMEVLKNIDGLSPATLMWLQKKYNYHKSFLRFVIEKQKNKKFKKKIKQKINVP